jgi:hypothetical protein
LGTPCAALKSDLRTLTFARNLIAGTVTGYAGPFAEPNFCLQQLSLMHNHRALNVGGLLLTA